MKHPFILPEDNIRDRDLPEARTRHWLEDVAPPTSDSGQEEYLVSALARRRLRVSGGIFFAILFFLLASSAKLQIMNVEKYRAASELNRVRIATINPPRGIIEDRNGVPLTKNVPRFQISINPLTIPASGMRRLEMISALAQIAEKTDSEIADAANMQSRLIAPLILRTGLTLDEVYPLILQRPDIPELTLDTISVREYIGGPEFSHLLGYIGPISAEDKDFYLAEGYGINDFVGKVGLEYTMESVLRGKAGRQYIEVDARGKIQQVIASEDASAGANLRITIDAKLQNAVADLLAQGIISAGARKGAVVVLNPQTGAVLALVSQPSYDNNIFSARTDQGTAFEELFADRDNPLFPRATSGMYPTGSTIKPLIAAAALSEGIINSSTTFLSAGGLRINQWYFPDWKAGGHGATNVRKALAESVNTFFYIIGGGYDKSRGLGIPMLASYLRKFGFGRKTGIEIPGEAAGLVPTPQWKEETKGAPWYIGDTYHLAIGQGDMLATPLQLARMTAYFASEGIWTAPHLISSNGNGGITDRNVGPEIDPFNIEVVRLGLRDAVRYGSARSLQSLPVSSAGKTGTAQWSSTGKEHAWFTGWAPFDNAQITVTVLIEEGGEGSVAAAPVAREIMRWWYDNRPEAP